MYDLHLFYLFIFPVFAFLCADPPGPARLEFDPLVVVKGQALTMHCIVEERGRPAAHVYRWMRGTHVQPEIRSYNWTIYPVSLETRTNFSCQALNEAGFGNPGFLTIDVYGKLARKKPDEDDIAPENLK